MMRMIMVPGFKITTAKTTLVVPHYYVAVPTIQSADAITTQQLCKALRLSQKELNQHLTAVFEDGWRYKLKWYTRYWIRWYYKHYPDLLQEDGEMAGFDASVLAQYFWPGETRDGHAKTHIREVLHEWGQNEHQRMLATQD